MPIEIIESKSAVSFLKDISLENKRHDGLLSDYIFRGQANSLWPIIPSAFRETAPLFREDDSPVDMQRRSNRCQVESEYYMLHKFCMELQNSGLYIPNEAILARHDHTDELLNFHSKIGRCEHPWPSSEYLSLIALAQHYGLPTRFTDWSLDPFVSAYFSVTSWFEQSSKPEYISVFALNTMISEVRNYGFEESTESFSRIQSDSYQLVRSPSFFNDHLKAQRGLFLAYIQRNFHPNKKLKVFSVEDHLENVHTSESNFLSSTQPLAYKYILHNKHCKELFRLIQKRGYTASRIYPGIHGCVKSIYENSRFI